MPAKHFAAAAIAVGNLLPVSPAKAADAAEQPDTFDQIVVVANKDERSIRDVAATVIDAERIGLERPHGRRRRIAVVIGRHPRKAATSPIVPRSSSCRRKVISRVSAS